MNGFVVLDKPAGATSFKAAAGLRKLYNEKKIGHTGTLDPMATGVLPVALGRATRFIDFLPSDEKEYLARVRFGLTTDTLDITGKVLTETPCGITSDEVRSALPAFTGEITQIPPMYSALKVEGKRLYDLARRGLEVERRERRVTVHALSLTEEFPDGEFCLRVRCSKGTYVRTLVDDLGRLLGPGAVLTALRRTFANGFSIENAVSPEALASDPLRALLSVDAPFSSLPEVRVTEKQAARFLNGGGLSLERLKNAESVTGRCRVLSETGTFLGLGSLEREKESLFPLRVYHQE